MPSPEELVARLKDRQARLADLSAADFQAWRHHPVSQAVLRFLADYRDEIECRVLEQWRSGALKLADEHEARGRAAIAAEMADITLPVLWGFYGITNPTDPTGKG